MNILRNLWKSVNRPLPGWLTIVVLCTAVAGAAVPTYYGKLSAYGGAADTPVVVTANASQSADILDVQTYSGANILKIDSSPNLYLGSQVSEKITDGGLYFTNSGFDVNSLVSCDGVAGSILTLEHPLSAAYWTQSGTATGFCGDVNRPATSRPSGTSRASWARSRAK